MATEQQYIVGGNSARSGATQLCPLTVNGANTVKSQIAMPVNSWLKALALETPATISGTSPVCNVRIGVTDTGQEILADTQAQSQGHIAATIATAFDKVAGLAAIGTLFVQVTTTGSGGLTGTINVLVSYDPPTR